MQVPDEDLRTPAGMWAVPLPFEDDLRSLQVDEKRVGARGGARNTASPPL